MLYMLGRIGRHDNVMQLSLFNALFYMQLLYKTMKSWSCIRFKYFVMFHKKRKTFYFTRNIVATFYARMGFKYSRITKVKLSLGKPQIFQFFWKFSNFKPDPVRVQSLKNKILIHCKRHRNKDLEPIGATLKRFHIDQSE